MVDPNVMRQLQMAQEATDANLERQRQMSARSQAIAVLALDPEKTFTDFEGRKELQVAAASFLLNAFQREGEIAAAPVNAPQPENGTIAGMIRGR